MVRDRELTEAEKTTLLGLVRHPTLNNRELAEELGLKPPTVTAICRRLRRKAMYRTVRIPLVASLGWEIMSFVWGDINVLYKDDEVVTILSRQTKDIPAFAYIADGSKYAVLGYAKDYTMAQRSLGEIVADKGLQQIMDGDLKVLFLPLRLTKFRRLFDHSPLLAHHFGQSEAGMPELDPPGDRRRLTATEKAVLKGLVIHPDASDKEVAKATGTSRQTVSRLRKEFEEQGVIRTINDVNHVALGYRMFYFFRLRAPPSKSRGSLDEILESVIGPEDFLAATTHTDLVLAGFCRDFPELNAKHRNIKKVLDANNISAGEWNFEILTTDSLRFAVRHDYERIVDFLDRDPGCCHQHVSTRKPKGKRGR